MAYDVRETNSFAAALESIVAYLRYQGGRGSAAHFLDLYESRRETLSSAPFHGATVGSHNGIPQKDALRWVPVDGYVAVYRAFEERGVVILEDLFYNGSDWKSTFSNRT